jgi:hypothetical protein
MAHAAEQFDVINLEALTGPAPIPQPTTRQFALNVFDRDPKASR